MRILLASDIHGSPRAATVIQKNVAKASPDLFVACGDLTDFGPVSFAEELLRSIPVKTFAVPGNCDPYELVKSLDEMGVNLHGKKAKFGGVTFVGLGGSNPTPFRTPFEISEDEIARILEIAMEPKAVLISHPPPFGFGDVTRNGVHVGSRAVKAIVDKYQPRLVMTGHIHEARGIFKGPSTIVNPGPASRGNFALIDLDGDVRANLM